jgi:hypothetical protein
VRYKSKVEVELLQRALRSGGGADALATRLCIPLAALEDYLGGRSRVPTRIYRETTRVLIEAGALESPGRAARALDRALRIAGGVAPLAARVSVPVALLQAYLEDKARVPPRVYREALRIVVEAETGSPDSE